MSMWHHDRCIEQCIEKLTCSHTIICKGCFHGEKAELHHRCMNLGFYIHEVQDSVIAALLNPVCFDKLFQLYCERHYINISTHILEYVVSVFIWFENKFSLNIRLRIWYFWNKDFEYGLRSLITCKLDFCWFVLRTLVELQLCMTFCWLLLRSRRRRC
jgi:hypothetical protein